MDTATQGNSPPPTDSFNDYCRPEQVAQQYPHIWSKWALIRECRQAEHNGMREMGVCFKHKTKTYVNVPKLFQWFKKTHNIG